MNRKSFSSTIHSNEEGVDQQQRQQCFHDYVKVWKEKRKEVEKWKKQMEQFHTSSETPSFENSARRFEEKLQHIDEQLAKASLDGTDTDFEIFFQEQCQKQKMSEDQKREKEKQQQEWEQEQKKVLEKMYQQERKERIHTKYSETNMNREYQYLLRMDQTFPEYMRRNLEKMTNNKGYIWKGIHYYGHLPLSSRDDPDRWTMFEKKKHELLIHEVWYGRYKRIYRKIGNQEKVLVQEIIYSK